MSSIATADYPSRKQNESVLRSWARARYENRRHTIRDIRESRSQEMKVLVLSRRKCKRNHQSREVHNRHASSGKRVKTDSSTLVADTKFSRSTLLSS